MTTTDLPDITLKDVIIHMQHMEQRLTKKITDSEQKLSARIDINSRDIRLLSIKIEDLTAHVEQLDVDLQSTNVAMLTIRQHVGMSMPED
jgi:ribosomal protein S15P/S13E